MNRNNEEQRPISQTLCGALQKEANCKCLVLSVLIYGCLAAVTWCRCANVTKIVINFSKYPLKSTRHVSPCDDGYIYIPVAFMGMLYLVYLVECYHSPIRIDLLHGESQDSVLSKLSQLRLAQPTIWWKAVSYHYVRRKRQITRYRNGDNYTTTQVYYERINSHAATSFYFYDYCGVKDISKDLIMDPKIPITKITLSKGFAFSNMRSATEFEEARSRFFAEQELRDDYMEMREGLDLGYNFNSSTTLVAVLGKPWFTNAYVYWCLSALLLSWPLRIIIECHTQYANYQVTKLFGVNYDTPTSATQIHASSSQLSAPGSYMLAPSYSEALLMEPAGPTSQEIFTGASNYQDNSEMLVPSYSEALLYERAASSCNQVHEVTCSVGRSVTNQSLVAVVEAPSTNCNCPCHQTDNNEEQVHTNYCGQFRGHSTPDIRVCSTCNGSYNPREEGFSNMVRDISAPNLKSHSSFSMGNLNLQFLKDNGRSLENILESEENFLASSEIRECDSRAKGAIPKQNLQGTSNSYNHCSQDQARSSRMVDIIVSSHLPTSKTYFSLKSILKQHKRRYTLVTTEELKNFTDVQDKNNEINNDSVIVLHENASKKRLWVSPMENKWDNNPHRTLIFASPIHEICKSTDPFTEADGECTGINNSDLPVLTRLGQSLTVLEESKASSNNSNSNSNNNFIINNITHKCKNKPRFKHHHRTMSDEPEFSKIFSSSDDPNCSRNNEITTSSSNRFITSGLTRSLTERRPKPPIRDKYFRHSFTDERTDLGPAKRINLNMETSL
ncbi:uncharacterized protein [Chelonus insularis]|uniref:uncharacterized protein n=1 Tax=Chelonus insularis TaxID=460826 RepID=UPI00158C18D4|nr:uncharacterized protein LOC118070794 [Chelonus insularis]